MFALFFFETETSIFKDLQTERHRYFKFLKTATGVEHSFKSLNIFNSDMKMQSLNTATSWRI